MNPRSIAVALALLTAVAGSACASKQSPAPAAGGQTVTGTPAAAAVDVAATDTGCALSPATGGAGPVTFLVSNNGSKVTEVYVYADGGRVLGEVENIPPGLQRQLQLDLDKPGTYTVACKPGMVGDGIRTDFVVKSP
ncbi:MAG: cupredoxin domain-containing protein [Mycobacterium sp.]